MRLDTSKCEELLRRAERATLATLQPIRGVDAVPACFSYHDGRVAVPVDRVKEKSAAVLQRVRNLEADPRAVLLCDHWDLHDWSRLWWVRATLEWVADLSELNGELEVLVGLLERKHRQYEGRPFADLLIFRITELAGWAASPTTIPG